MWSPAITISVILRTIKGTIFDPNLLDCSNPEVAEIFRKDKASFEMKAKEETKKYSV